MSLIVDIKKSLGGFALNVCFEAGGGTLGLLGASGCGKSMTLKCIAGVERPDSGHIELDGRVLFDSARKIDLPPQERMVGYLFQSYALFPDMDVRKNILCGLCRERDAGKRESALAAAISAMGLEGLERRRPAQLSGGQQQRVALARILVGKPRLLMLDEPFSALDSHLRARLQLEVRSLLSGFDGPALFVTHDRNEAYGMCGRIAVMEGGRILALKPTRELFASPGSIQAAVVTGCKNITAAVRIDDHTLEAPQWGLRLATAEILREGLAAVGVRAHAFKPCAGQNSFEARLLPAVDEPFETTIPFRTALQAEDAEALWWRAAKPFEAPLGESCTLSVDPRDVLPLY